MSLCELVDNIGQGNGWLQLWKQQLPTLLQRFADLDDISASFLVR